MICPKCGFDGETKFCPKCGSPLSGSKRVYNKIDNSNNSKVVLANDPIRQARIENNVANVYAFVGLGLGVGSFLLCIIPFLSIILAILGVIFSKFGLKSNRFENVGIWGIVFSTIGFILNIVFTILILRVLL